MQTHGFPVRSILATLLCLMTCRGAVAVRPSETLLPNQTNGVLSVADVEQLETSFDKTQIGQMALDPVMEPFTEDLKRQLKSKWDRVYEKFGLTLDDVREIPGGEVAVAQIQPSPTEAALAIVVDVTGKLDETAKMMRKIDDNMSRKKATKAVRDVAGTQVTTYTLPKKQGEKKPGQAVFFINENMFCAADHAGVAAGILGRFSGEPTDNLASLPAYRSIMARAKQSAGELAPEVRWYLNPFDYIETMRIADPSRRKKGKDLVKILQGQGFDAVQGIGGYVNFYVNNQYELVHRTAIYAPPVKDAVKDERYKLAARMMRFPNGGTLEPESWVPRGLATYLSLNWEVQRAFDYADTLVDAFVGEEGVFKDVLRSIEEDPNGPQIDIRKDLVAHLGTHCTLISDYQLPVTPKCERMVFGINATNPTALAKTIEKIMKTDPNAHRRVVGGHVVWEIIEEEAELPKLDIDSSVFDPVGGDDDPVDDGGLPNSAVCVTDGHFFIASHIDLLKLVLAKADQRETLGHSVDFRTVMAELDKVADPERSFRFFSRTDEEYRPTYELIRAGRMPESETLFGRILNGLFGEGKEDELRPQKIDGRRLPDFETVRRYFGPAGLSVITEENGWFMIGLTLSKETP